LKFEEYPSLDVSRSLPVLLQAYKDYFGAPSELPEWTLENTTVGVLPPSAV
jgi:hypothetical protein